jgi:uncharacterized protein
LYFGIHKSYLMKTILVLILCITSFSAFAQTDSLQALSDIAVFQKTLNEEYKNRKESPLDEKDFAEFKGHDFFPVSLKYRVVAKLTVTEGSAFFPMKTTTTRLSTERIYGYVSFTIAGKEFRLPVYQSKDLMQTAEYADYLFFPFTDETNGYQTYGGGRYIDLRIPKEGNELIIDFNKAYNPYCAYNGRFSCPLVPKENQMNIEIPAGVKYKDKKVTQNASSSEDQIFMVAQSAPEYPGGYNEMIAFINKNVTHPKSATDDKKHGTVYVEFVVEKDGTLSRIRTIKGLSADYDREAERIVSLMPKWKPGKENNKYVTVRFVLPIKFE